MNYRTGSAIHEGTHRDGVEPPVHFWVPSIAVAGMTAYTGDLFPAWRGNLFVAGMAGQQLARLTMDAQEVRLEETLAYGVGRIRDVAQGPDGYLYLAVEDREGRADAHLQDGAWRREVTGGPIRVPDDLRGMPPGEPGRRVRRRK